jgi:hypothetical protein
VQYIGNTVTNAKKYGVVIEVFPLSSPPLTCFPLTLSSSEQQDYTNDGATGKATNGVPINGVYFTGTTNNVSVGSKAQRVYVVCPAFQPSWTALLTLSVRRAALRVRLMLELRLYGAQDVRRIRRLHRGHDRQGLFAVRDRQASSPSLSLPHMLSPSSLA